jgi:hypothetical protein
VDALGDILIGQDPMFASTAEVRLAAWKPKDATTAPHSVSEPLDALKSQQHDPSRPPDARGAGRVFLIRPAARAPLVQDLPSLPVVYQEAHYSLDQDVPARLRSFAGKDFRLHGTTAAYLQPAETGASWSGSLDRLLRESRGSWVLHCALVIHPISCLCKSLTFLNKSIRAATGGRRAGIPLLETNLYSSHPAHRPTRRRWNGSKKTLIRIPRVSFSSLKTSAVLWRLELILLDSDLFPVCRNVPKQEASGLTGEIDCLLF